MHHWRMMIGGRIEESRWKAGKHSRFIMQVEENDVEAKGEKYLILMHVVQKNKY